MDRLIAVVIEATDVGRTVALYRDGFGLDLHVDDHEGGLQGRDDRWTSGMHGACSWTDGAFLHFAIYPAQEDGPTRNVQIGFTTDDLDASHERALAHGAEVVHEARDEPWGRTSRYRDFDGNVVSFTART